MLGLVVAPVTAQLGRVEDGRAGDANLRVGSGGRNLPRRAPLRGYGNEIISGNITRGRHFRSDSPISATTDFGAQLPSAALDNFRRDSIGYDDIQSGQPSYLPRPYYSRTGTVPTAGALSSGFRPSGVRPRPRSYIHLPSDPLGQRTRRLQPYSREIRISPTSDRPNPTPSPEASDFERTHDAPLTRSALFGVAPDPARTVLESYSARPSRTREAGTSPYSRLRAVPGGPTRRETDRQPVTAEERRRALPAGSALDRLLGRGRAAVPLPTPPSAGADRTTQGPETDQKRPASEMRSYTETTAAGQAEPARPGEAPPETPEEAKGDVYRMMRMAASTIMKPIAPPPDDTTAAPRAPRATAAELERADEAEPAQPTPPPRRPRASEQQDELQELLARPVATFAGEAKTLANEAFKEAEKRLTAGRFFDAVTSYDIARAADPGNPLVWIGRGHALVGAGDYLSASASLEKGLMRFPEITRFQIDLKAFLGHGDILDIRRADLEHRLDQKENYRFRFLLGYLEYYSGLEKFGLANLKQAAKEAPTTSIIAKFPKLLGK